VNKTEFAGMLGKEGFPLSALDRSHGYSASASADCAPGEDSRSQRVSCYSGRINDSERRPSPALPPSGSPPAIPSPEALQCRYFLRQAAQTLPGDAHQAWRLRILPFPAGLRA